VLAKLLFRLAILCAILSVTVASATACQCGGSGPVSQWEIAKAATEHSDVVFLGTLERTEMKWPFLDAKNGEVTAAFLNGPDSPQMVITVRVQHVYKGQLGDTVQLFTGLGGGDCGASYSPGLTHLIFASRFSGKLMVSICSPGGWVGYNSMQTALRFLSNEPPKPSDLVRPDYSKNKYAEEQKRLKKTYDENDARAAEATGEICGKIPANSGSFGNRAIYFLPVSGWSPLISPSRGATKEDGSFCSHRLGPGKYYVFAIEKDAKDPKGSTLWAGYYPGVSDAVNAQVLEVSAGRTLSGITFSIPLQKTVVVRGMVWAKEEMGPKAGGPDIAMINVDSPGIFFSQRSPGWLLKRLAFFSFDDVPPGHYLAFTVEGHLITLNRDIVVSAHTKYVALEVAHAKPPTPPDKVH
jgi:hypothetical protein